MLSRVEHEKSFITSGSEFSSLTLPLRHTKNVYMTRERTIFTFDPNDMVLTRHISVSFVRTAHKL